MPIKMAKTDTNIARCYPVLAQLRPHLIEAEFVTLFRTLETEGYRLAFAEREGTVCAVAGFRLSANLAWGKFLYIEDLVTNQALRSQGLGSLLFDWCREYAQHEGCNKLLLDSGVQRFAAHRFYLGKRMNISSHRFSLDLK